jgi:ribosomal protein S18 acetylase RimI-like enzyme
MKVKYTVADYRRIHQGIIEDMIDTCISKWHDQEHDPLEARVYRNLAFALEDLRNAEDCLLKARPANLNVWVSAANAEVASKTRDKAQ